MCVKRHLCLFGAISPHAPRLHTAGAHRIEPDVFPVTVIFGAVVQAERRRELSLVTARGRNGVYVIFAIPFRAVGEHLAIGSDTVEVARGKRRHQFRHATVKENLVNARKPVFFSMVAHIEAFAIRRKYMVVVTVIDKVTRHFAHVARRNLVFIDAAFAVESEELAIGAPVGRLNHAVKFVEQFRLSRLDIENFQIRLVAATVPHLARRKLERITYTPRGTEAIHLRHHLHRLRVRHFGAFLETLL